MVFGALTRASARGESGESVLRPSTAVGRQFATSGAAAEKVCFAVVACTGTTHRSLEAKAWSHASGFAASSGCSLVA
jgi:hypothetical protein